VTGRYYLCTIEQFKNGNASDFLSPIRCQTLITYYLSSAIYYWYIVEMSISFIKALLGDIFFKKYFKIILKTY